jgi:hypothetical protein
MAGTRDDLATQFRNFVKLEGRSYSPLYERLSTVIADDPALLALLDDASAHQRQPTLLYAALHDCVLAHPQEELARWYPTVTGGPVPDVDLAPTLRAFCKAHERELRNTLATRATQTNEVRRCAALLLIFDLVASEIRQPLGLVELGASAGLNLLFDRYAYDYEGLGSAGAAGSSVTVPTSFHGAHRPRLPAVPQVGERLGIDLAPIDVRDEAATRWLQACLFADQLDRLQRLRTALALARQSPPTVWQGDLLERLPDAAARVPADQHLCVFSTWVVHYLNASQRRALVDLLSQLGAARDLSWIAAEPAGVVPGLAEPPPDPAHPQATILSLTTFRRGVRWSRVLARMHSHAAWIEWLA